MKYSVDKFVPGLGTQFHLDPAHISEVGGADKYIPGLGLLSQVDYSKHVSASGGADKYVPGLGKQFFVHPDHVINKPAPALTADSTSNDGLNPIEITFADDTHWRSKITSVKSDGVALDEADYTVSEGVITINAGVLTTGTYVISVEADGYVETSVSQDIV